MKYICKCNPAVLSQKTDSGGILLNLETGKYHVCCSVGIRIWELIQEGCTPQSLMRSIQDEFNVPDGTDLHNDIGNFLDAMTLNRLLLP